MTTVDEAYENFLQFKSDFDEYIKADLSEADTRSKVLDNVLIKVLGWTEKDINREKYVQVGYYDYLISIPGFQFVIEAKKNYVQFQLPIKHKSIHLGTFRQGNSEVVDQIRRYLFEVGLQYGIISNGRQIIVAKFVNSDGSDWLKNKCYIFNGIVDIETRFVEFFNLLSKLAVIENAGLEISNEETQKSNIILASISGRDKELIRNTLSSSLRPVIDEVFGEIYKYEILDNKELIEECFIQNEEIKKNKSDIEKLFADRPPELPEVIPARNTKNIARQIESEIQNYPIALKDIDPPKPIIIVGSKGAGKTTFINYLFKVSFTTDFLESRPHIYLDFRKYTDEDLERINSVVIRDAIDYLYDNYPNYGLTTNKVLRRVFLKEIKQNDESIWSYDKENNIDRYNEKLNSFLEKNRDDKEFYFIKISEYLLRERRLRLCVVIDNADQFDINVQGKAFLFAQSINRKARCSVIISLREGYYYRWRHQPPFDAFDKSNVYHITAPPYKEVLQKRIDYALEHVQIDGKSSGLFGSSFTVKVDNNSVKHFLQSLRQSLFGPENSAMLNFLEETTYPNIREGLEIFKYFLLSGHVDVAQYILRAQMNPDSKQPIPFQEFFKAVALDNKKYYNHEISRINNLFYPCDNSSSHFLKIRILKFLYARVEKLGYTEKFILTNHVIVAFSNAGYKLNIVISELNELLRFRFIETDDSVSDKEFDAELSTHQNVTISAKGNFYLNNLINSFTYLDLMLQDTPIFDFSAYEEIRKNFPLTNEEGKQNLLGRIQTTQAFVEYLKNQERKEKIESDEIPQNIVDKMLADGLDQDITRIKKVQQRAEKNQFLN